MLRKGYLLPLLILITSVYSCSRDEVVSFGFYNVENLFDTIDNPETVDEEYLPSSNRMWNTDKYESKLVNLSKVISKMVNGDAPDVLGLCEVENRKVIEDLIGQDALRLKHYAIVHEESIDVRGIDVAAIYDTTKFTLVDYGTKRVNLTAFEDITRDILWLKLADVSNERPIYFIVNHWPSRRGGLKESEPKRIATAETLKQLVSELKSADESIPVLICGDFNDEPNNQSISSTLGAKWGSSITTNTQFFNAMGPLKDQGKGSYCYRGNWNMLDQFIGSVDLRVNQGWDYVTGSATIMDHDWMRQHSEKYEGYPLRTFGGPNYLNGYSDHFPVFVLLNRPIR